MYFTDFLVASSRRAEGRRTFNPPVPGPLFPIHLAYFPGAAEKGGTNSGRAKK